MIFSKIKLNCKKNFAFLQMNTIYYTYITFSSNFEIFDNKLSGRIINIVGINFFEHRTHSSKFKVIYEFTFAHRKIEDMSKC